MKNNASNPCSIKAGTKQACEKQALQTQAQRILPALTDSFSKIHYNEISHQRLSQHNNGGETDYQGLTRAKHKQFGTVMLKWQLSSKMQPHSAGLQYEISVLNALSNVPKTPKDTIAPPVLTNNHLNVPLLNQNLTILVMPYYRNGSLATQLSAQQHLLLTNRQKHHFITKSASLIAYLHQAGWLHNDIKPSNILLDSILPSHAKNSSVTSDLLLTDFALATRFNTLSSINSGGTPAYLAPERLQGQVATVQSDIYAFGIMMTEILMGVRPFKINSEHGDLLKEWAIQHCQQPIPKLLSEYSRYQSIIDKALAKRIGKRYQNMEEVLGDLALLQIGKVYY